MDSPRRKPRVAVVFGGRSGEHSISCISAGSVIAALDPEKYDVVPVGITREGRWVVASDDPAVWELRSDRHVVPAEKKLPTPLFVPHLPTTTHILNNKLFTH